mgnify:FL=1
MYCRLEHNNPQLREDNPRRAIMAIGEVEEYYLAVIPSQGSRVYAVLKTEYAPVSDQDGHEVI